MLKASYEPLKVTKDNSFLIRSFNEKSFSAPYHFHPELELTLILKGEGKRYVGSNMSNYIAGDFVLLGPNLPHCWKSENIKGEKMAASSLVIQFTEDFLGQDFFSRPEMSSIAQMLGKSRFGMQFLGKLAADAKESMIALVNEESNFKKLILLLEMLQQLSTSRQYKLLDKQKQNFYQSLVEQKRINDVLAYIVDHFRETILLEKAASIAGMTPTAFCKFFKRATRKTFIQMVMEFRINYAMQQLVHTEKSISDIAFDSGFGDVSHFFKTFKKEKKLSPLNYRKNFAKEIM